MRTRWKTITLAKSPKRRSPGGASEIALLPSFPQGEIVHATAAANQPSPAGTVQGFAELYYILEGEGELWRATGRVQTVTRLRPRSCVTVCPGTDYQYRADGADMKFLVATAPRFNLKNWKKATRRYWNEGRKARRRSTQPGPWTTTQLPAAYNYLAPDGSEIRLLPSLDAGGLAHCTLPAGAVSAAVRHKTVKEVWYVLAGRGEVWRDQEDDHELVAVEPDMCLTIPTGVSFQFRASGDGPLEIMIGTFPAWPGPDEAEPVRGKWEVPPRIALRHDHVALRVRDYDATVRWYIDKLGFRVVREWPSRDMRLCYLENGLTRVEIMGGGEVQLSEEPLDFESSLRRPGYHHLSLMVDDVQQTTAILRERGVAVIEGPRDVGEIERRIAFVRDDNANIIELVGKL